MLGALSREKVCPSRSGYGLGADIGIGCTGCRPAVAVGAPVR